MFTNFVFNKEKEEKKVKKKINEPLTRLEYYRNAFTKNRMFRFYVVLRCTCNKKLEKLPKLKNFGAVRNSGSGCESLERWSARD